MNAKSICGALAFVVCAAAQIELSAQDARLLAPVPAFSEQPAGKGDPKQKDKDKKQDEKKIIEPPQTNLFTRFTGPRTQTSSGFNPNMLGDFYGYCARVPVTVFTTVTTNIPPGPGNNNIPFSNTRTTAATELAIVGVPTRGAFKVAEGASPRPQDRLIGAYHYYNSVGNQIAAPLGTTIQVTPIPGPVPMDATVTTTRTLAGGIPSPFANLHREVFGFEKTFLDGRASVELRVPFLQQQGDDPFAAHHVGDLTIITKYAFILDPVSGNVFSAGLAVTAPTGPAIETIEGTIRSTLLQPWFGYIWNGERGFVHGFHSIVVPTDHRDTTLLFNDVGMTYWLYRDPNRLMSFVAPTAEIHITTPLNQRGLADAFCVHDLVTLTGGVHVGVGRSTVSFGVATPITGPRPFDVEVFVQLNRFF